MELGIMIVLGAVAAGLGYFWVNGVTQGDLRMRHRP